MIPPPDRVGNIYLTRLSELTHGKKTCPPYLLEIIDNDALSQP